MKEKTLVVMAAGMGSRFGGLKQIEPVGPSGEFILDYSIYDAIKAGFNKVVFVIKEENSEVFKSTIGVRIEDKIEVNYAYQRLDDLPEGFNVPIGRVKPWGTAHAIYAARKYINGPFGIINADDFYGRDAFMVLSNFFDNLNNDETTYSIVGYNVGKTMTEYGSVKRGVIESDENNNLLSIEECTISKDSNGKIIADPLDLLSGKETGNIRELKEDYPVNMNLIGVDKSFINYLEEDIVNFLNNMKDPLKSEYGLPYVLLKTIRVGKSTVKLLTTTSKWYGMTYREDLVELKSGIKKLIDEGIYKEDLWS